MSQPTNQQTRTTEIDVLNIELLWSIDLAYPLTTTTYTLRRISTRASLRAFKLPQCYSVTLIMMFIHCIEYKFLMLKLEFVATVVKRLHHDEKVSLW
jgi:hypothetical protein